MKNMVTELIHRAKKAWYADGFIYVLLEDQKQLSFPVSLNQKLSQASEAQLKHLDLICNGTGIHWPDLDEDLSILGVLEGRYGK